MHTTQGARVGANVFIDSLDVSDLDLVIIGDGAVINEGATITGHYFKDGMLHFGAVRAQRPIWVGPADAAQHEPQPVCRRITMAYAVRARRPTHSVLALSPSLRAYAWHSVSHACILLVQPCSLKGAL